MADHLIVEPPPFEQPPLPPETFAGRAVLVTGGGSGMGLAMANAFAQFGASVALMGRTLEKVEASAAQLAKLGVKTIGVSADVRDPAQIAAAFDKAEAALGPITLLANNAGGNFPVLSDTMSTNAWRAITQIAIDGTFLASAELARRCKARGDAGAIVNNSAQYIWTGFPGDAHSAAAKTAVATMSRKMAAEWRGDRIRVNCVAAGFFPHADSISANNPDHAVLLDGMMPAGRVGRIREFGWVSAFLCSPYASGINGEILMIDGGESLRKSLMSPPFIPPRERSQIWGYEA